MKLTLRFATSFASGLLIILVIAGCNRPSDVPRDNTPASVRNGDFVPTQEQNPVTNQTSTPDPKVANIVEFIKNDKNAGKFISRMKFSNDDAIQVVFSSGGNRYTVYYSGIEGIKNPWLAYWVRPNGTSGQKSIVTFSAGMDGFAQFGINGKDGKIFTDEDDRKRGLELREYFQKQFDDAVAVTLKHIGS